MSISGNLMRYCVYQTETNLSCVSIKIFLFCTKLWKWWIILYVRFYVKTCTHKAIPQSVASVNEKTKAVHFWSFLREIHQLPMDSLHKGPVLRRAFACHDVFIMEISHSLSCDPMRCQTHDPQWAYNLCPKVVWNKNHNLYIFYIKSHT